LSEIGISAKPEEKNMDYTWELYGSREDPGNIRLYETIVHREDMPFRIFNIKRSRMAKDDGAIVDVMEHWHPELEIVFVFAGHSVHYIDGHAYVASPGQIFIVNPNSIHKIISDKESFVDDAPVAVSLNIKEDFVRNLIPEFDAYHFLPTVEECDPEIAKIMREFYDSEERETEWNRYEGLRLTELLCRLLGMLWKRALVSNESVLRKKGLKNQEKLNDILQYIGTHYTESLSQQQLASEFYFTKEYFCRFFKANTGMTFKEYLSDYRVNAARYDLVYTEKSILEIAIKHGFSDARGYIKAFKKMYNITPLQYRKSLKKDNFE
jgi:AraC-like DNA-binding protein